ncbi:MAG: hypothetical protein V3W34_18345 [Phycisphaerae bacterium]
MYHTRMNPFLRVLEALGQSGVRYVIVGGFAAVEILRQLEKPKEHQR